MKTVINHFIYRNESFVIAQDNEYYVAINRKDIDENGKLKRALNGFQMYANKKLNDTLDRVMDNLDIKAHGFKHDDLLNNPNLLMDIMNGKYRA